MILKNLRPLWDFKTIGLENFVCVQVVVVFWGNWLKEHRVYQFDVIYVMYWLFTSRGWC